MLISPHLKGNAFFQAGLPCNPPRHYSGIQEDEFRVGYVSALAHRLERMKQLRIPGLPIYAPY